MTDRGRELGTALLEESYQLKKRGIMKCRKKVQKYKDSLLDKMSSERKKIISNYKVKQVLAS